VKKIVFHPGVPGQLRAIEQQTALGILKAIHRGFSGFGPAITVSFLMRRPTPSRCTAFAIAATLINEVNPSLIGPDR